MRLEVRSEKREFRSKQTEEKKGDRQTEVRKKHTDGSEKATDRHRNRDRQIRRNANLLTTTS